MKPLFSDVAFPWGKGNKGGEPFDFPAFCLEALSGPQYEAQCGEGYAKYSLEVLFGGGDRFEMEEAETAWICRADLQYGREESYIVK